MVMTEEDREAGDINKAITEDLIIEIIIGDHIKNIEVSIKNLFLSGMINQDKGYKKKRQRNKDIIMMIHINNSIKIN